MYEFACLPFSLSSAPRVFTKLIKHNSRTPSGQNQESKKGMSVLTGLATSNSETTSQVTGPSYFYHSSCLFKAPPLPPLAKREKQGFSTFSNLRLLYCPFPSGERGVGLVEGQPGSMEWKSSRLEFSRLSNRERYLPTGSGSVLQRSVHRGSVVSRGNSFAHKLSRASSWRLCCQGLCERKSSNAAHHINKMGSTKSRSGTSGIRSVVVVPSSQYPHRGSVFTRVLNIRADQESRVFLDQHDWKLDPLLFAERNQPWGPLEVDLFATRLSSQLPQFYS